jgi:hypothetical protein
LEEPERRSTLYLKGEAAMTLAEMQNFVEDVKTRPRTRLLADIPQLLALTESKVLLVERALTQRMKDFSPKERSEVFAVLMQQSQAGRGEAVRERAKHVLAALSRFS